MSDTSPSRPWSLGRDLLDDNESYLRDLSEEELVSVFGGARETIAQTLKTKGVQTTAINCTTIGPKTETGFVTTAISCTCHPGTIPTPPCPQPTPPLPKPTPPVVIDPHPQPMTTAWFCTLY